jgi:hypothetical protein
MNKNQKILLDYLKQETLIKFSPMEVIRNFEVKYEFDVLEPIIELAMNNLTRKEEFEVLAEFAKWGLENEN